MIAASSRYRCDRWRRLLASGGQDGQITIRSTGALIDPLDRTLNAPPKRVKFSPCGRYLAVATVDVNQGVQLLMFNAHAIEKIWTRTLDPLSEVLEGWGAALPRWALAFHPSGDALCYVDADLAIRRRDSATGELQNRSTLKMPSTVQSIEYSATGDMVVVRLATEGTSSFDRLSGTQIGHAALRSLFYIGSPDHSDQWVEMGTSRDVLLRPTPSSPPTKTLRGPTEKIHAVAISSDGRYLAVGGEDHIVYFWDLARSDSPAKCVGHKGLITELCFAPDGATQISRSIDGTARLWHVATRPSSSSSARLPRRFSVWI